MALHFILDGYNVIKQTPVLADKKLEEGRNALLRLIENQKPQGSSNNKVTVVFDGQSGFVEDQRKSFANVIFTCNETADEKIKHLVSGQKNRKSLVVVTNDRDVRYYVRSLGAKILKVEEFLAKVRVVSKEKTQHMKRRVNLVSKSKREVPKTLEFKINAELQKIWLKKK